MSSSDNNFKITNAEDSVKTMQKFSENDQEYLIYGFDDRNIFGMELSQNRAIKMPDAKLTLENRRLSSADFFDESDSTFPPNSKVQFLVKPELPKWVEVQLTDTQIVSGNIGIDFTNPLFRGTFNSLSYSSDSGVKVKNLVDSLVHLNPECQFILVSFGRTEVSAISSRQNYLEVFADSDSKEDTLRTINILFFLLNYFREQKKDVFVVLDDAVSIFYRLFNIFHFLKNEVPLKEST